LLPKFRGRSKLIQSLFSTQFEIFQYRHPDCLGAIILIWKA